VKRRLIVVGLILAALAGCGQRAGLSPKTGQSLPVKPAGAATQPDADALLAPDIQARPARSDEQLLKSEERRDDKFDLPPPG
jgi:hypothetical protein